MTLTLSAAIQTGRLEEFAAQEELRGVGPIDRAEFDGAVSGAIKAPPPKGRTSRSAYAGNSSGKRTRRDSDPGASR
jgi:hypothetical protein